MFRVHCMTPRILIADDNPGVRSALKHLLENQEQWEISEANNGQEAISKAAEARPDVILIDLAMPVMDGLTAAREISKILPETPILMCTMHWSRQLELEAQKYGVRQVLSKTDTSTLLSAVQQTVSSKLPNSPDLIPERLRVTLPPNPTLPPAGGASSTPAATAAEVDTPKGDPKLRRCE